MHLIIVEDLDIDRESLSAMIFRDFRENGGTADISFYENGEAFLENYHAGNCDALFLDILLDGMSGIEVAERIRESEPRLPIIFTTTEPDFALDGFSVHAMDYLIKPLRADKVAWCLRELRDYLAAPAFLTLPEVCGRGHSRQRDIALDSILYGLYQNHCMEIRTTGGTVSTRLSFQDFTRLLPHTGRFYICGRGMVVNFSHVEWVESREILMKSGERLPLSRSRTQDARDAFASWLFSRSRKDGWT